MMMKYRKKPTWGMKEMKERVGVKRDPTGGEMARDFTSSERKEYGVYMREYRAKHGLVDGLRTDQEGFSDYLRKRREMDEKSRPGR
jgi:hypothetical protein